MPMLYDPSSRLSEGLGGRVPAPCLIVSNDGSTLIGKNTRDTDPTASPMGVMML